MEERITQLEQRVAALETGVAQAFQPAPVEDSPSPILDFALIGRSILIVGGAFLLRALTEAGWVPQLAGVALGFVYAMAWIVVAPETAALIAGALIVEATIRFHALDAPAGALLVVVTACALLFIARRRDSNAIALIVLAMTTLTLTGLAIGTADVLPCAIAATAIAVIAQRSVALMIVSDFFALALLAMTLLDRTPQPRLVVELTLVAIAVAWLVRPARIQTSVALFIGLGGASLLAFHAPTLVILWAAMSIATARHEPHGWMIAATAAAFATGTPTLSLAIVGAMSIIAYALASRARIVLLLIITLALLVNANALLTTSDAGTLAMQRSLLLAVTAALLTLLARRHPEAAIAARIVLGFAALKLLVEDFRFGHAATIAVALVAYGTVLLIISRKGESMKRILVLIALLALPLTAFADDAAVLYKSKCAMCHGANGTGDTPMGKKFAIKSFASADVQKHTDAQLAQTITKGSGKMPAFAGKLTDAQIKQLVAVVRGFVKK
ncbi:MAG: hypothetical protein DMF56_01355 [Acidobacteria bacterium]|nr:MAG: hypothetical protein DMF56_01355 [Acidobacteriota bacterium]